MNTEQFIQEMGALHRSLEMRVKNEPALKQEDLPGVIAHLERAIVGLTALTLKLRSMT